LTQVGTGDTNSYSDSEFFGDMFYDAKGGQGIIYGTPARESSTLQGRWLQVDPAQSGWNGYVYANNSPVTLNDPTGLDPAWAVWSSFGGAPGVVGYYGGDFGCTLDGIECKNDRLGGAFGLLGGNAIASCPQCRNSFKVVGADNQIYDYYATTQRFDYTKNGLVFTGADYTLLPTGEMAGAVGSSGWWNGLGLAAGAYFRSPRAIQAADAAKNFGKSLAQNQSTIEELWSDHTTLEWEKLVSEETNALKSLLNSYADGLDAILSGGNGLTIIPMISPNAMGCAGYGNLPCGNGHATSF
jgi:RHS repeat-associated protein